MHRLEAVAHAHLGRLDEARASVDAMLGLSPGYTISGWTKTFGATAYTADTLATYISGMRKPGVPE